MAGAPRSRWSAPSASWASRSPPSLCPHDEPDRGAGPLRELGALRNPQVWLTLAVGAVGFGGMFAVFTYITPTLVQVSGIPLAWVPAVLACFGAA